MGLRLNLRYNPETMFSLPGLNLTLTKDAAGI